MQWLLGELFAASAKSPQAMAIASVRMCGLWVQRPRIALLYLDFWERLLLFGSTDGGPFRASKLSSEAKSPAPVLSSWFPDRHMLRLRPFSAL